MMLLGVLWPLNFFMRASKKWCIEPVTVLKPQ